MSRARQVAKFDPSLFAADEVSGDKVHGGTISGSPTLVTPNLGTPASGTLTNATFPAGHVVKTTLFDIRNWNHISTGGASVIHNSWSFTCTSGNTIHIKFACRAYTDYNGGGTTNTRRGHMYMYYGSNKSIDDTSSLGTLIDHKEFGRKLVANSTSTTSEAWWGGTINGSFVSGATGTNYVTIAAGSDDSAVNCVTVAGANDIACLVITEYQGDVLTEET